MKKNILLVGPAVGKDLAGAYGGGTGGYTRKMQLYLQYFRSAAFEQKPCFHTVRGQSYPLGRVGRLFIDLYRFLRCLRSQPIAGVHLLGQYRGALLREYAMAQLSRWFGIPYLYEIKAGVFIDWYENTHMLNQLLMRQMLKHASQILAQGQPYVDFLKERWNLQAIYFPNFVPGAELGPISTELFSSRQLRILFVGYAIREKGVFELVTACRELAASFPIQLTLIGQENDEFSTWADQLTEHPAFELCRRGKLPHAEVLAAFGKHDIYCYPTRHKGEGHNNTINEAMMNGLVVVTTTQGFLGSIIGTDRGYLLEESSVAAIKATVIDVMSDQETARKKADRARQYLEANFLDKVAFAKLETGYRKMTSI